MNLNIFVFAIATITETTISHIPAQLSLHKRNIRSNEITHYMRFREIAQRRAWPLEARGKIAQRRVAPGEARPVTLAQGSAGLS